MLFLTTGQTAERKDYLSYEATVAFIVRDANERPWQKNLMPYNQVNPNLNSKLRKFIKRDDIPPKVRNAVLYVYGFIATQDDIEFLDNYIKEGIKRISENPQRKAKRLNENINTFSSLFLKNIQWGGLTSCIAIMVARDIPDAITLYKNYGAGVFWKELGCSTTVSNQFAGVFAQTVYKFSRNNLAKERTLDLISQLGENSFVMKQFKKTENKKQNLYNELMSGKGYMKQEDIPAFVDSIKKKYPTFFSHFE